VKEQNEYSMKIKE